MGEYRPLQELGTVGGERGREGRERERELRIRVRTWTNWNTIREPLRTSWNSGGSGGSSWRIVTARREARAQTSQAQPSVEKNGDAPLGYSGRRALRREQCVVFTPSRNC
jgi:hypothetical protein